MHAQTQFSAAVLEGNGEGTKWRRLSCGCDYFGFLPTYRVVRTQDTTKEMRLVYRSMRKRPASFRILLPALQKLTPLQGECEAKRCNRGVVPLKLSICLVPLHRRLFHACNRFKGDSKENTTLQRDILAGIFYLQKKRYVINMIHLLF